MRSPRVKRWFSKRVATTLLSALTLLSVVTLPAALPRSTGGLPLGLTRSLSPLSQAALAQRLTIPSVATSVYERLPDLPLENEYRTANSQDIAADNTLISRLLRYHLTVKGRSPNYRLDWKLTLADYLGVNETINPATYPGAELLATNPLEGDIAAIQQLNRAQRDTLVTTLANLFNPTAGTPPSGRPAEATPAPEPTPANRRPGMGSTSPLPNEPEPGDAQRLLQ